jgi:hypothetical protein
MKEITVHVEECDEGFAVVFNSPETGAIRSPVCATEAEAASLAANLWSTVLRSVNAKPQLVTNG